MAPGVEAASRAELMKALWPDKLLHAATLLLVTGLLGLLFALVRAGIEVAYSENVPASSASTRPGPPRSCPPSPRPSRTRA